MLQSYMLKVATYRVFCIHFTNEDLISLSSFKGKKVAAKYPGYAYFCIVLMIFAPLACIPGVAIIRYFGYCPYKSRGAETVDIDDDDQPTGTITPNLSRLPLTSNEEAPGSKDDNDEVIWGNT